MKPGIYNRQYLVPIEQPDLVMQLKDILAASIPSEPKGKIVMLEVTVEYDENQGKII